VFSKIFHLVPELAADFGLRGETVQCSSDKEYVPARRNGRWSDGWLRCGLELDAVVGQQATMHPA